MHRKERAQYQTSNQKSDKAGSTTTKRRQQAQGQVASREGSESEHKEIYHKNRGESQKSEGGRLTRMHGHRKPVLDFMSSESRRPRHEHDPAFSETGTQRSWVDSELGGAIKHLAESSLRPCRQVDPQWQRHGRARRFPPWKPGPWPACKQSRKTAPGSGRADRQQGVLQQDKGGCAGSPDASPCPDHHPAPEHRQHP